jgi:hypothetical protein
MSDIFISYSSEERPRVLPLINALEKTGWSVFWDRTIPAGKTWRQVIGDEIRTCRSVVVVWTERSITSEWVLEEAETGKRRQILIPVLLDEVEPPFGFGTIQAANLAAWDGTCSSPAFTRLVGDIAAVLGPAPIAVKEPEEHRRAEDEVSPESQQERFRQQELQRSEEESRREAEEENQRRVDQEANLGRLHVKGQASFENRPAIKAFPAAPRHAPEPRAVSISEHVIRCNRKKLHNVVRVAVIIGVAVMAFWSIGPSGTEDTPVKKLVSLGIQGERQLNPGEKTVLRAEARFSDGSKSEVTKNLHWQSSDDSVAAVNEAGRVEARKDGSSNITVRYEGTASPPLTLLVKAENPSSEADASEVITLPGVAPPKKVFTLDDISDLMKNGVRPNRIARLVEEHGVGFELDDRALQRLKQDGANDTILLAVRKISAPHTEERPQTQRQQDEVARRKRDQEAKRSEEQKHRPAKVAEPARKTEEVTKQKGSTATLRSPEAAGRVVNLRNVMSTEAGKVSGELVNNSTQTLRDVRLQILYSWQWKDEYHPGKDDPGKAIIHVLKQDIPPGQIVGFNYEPSPPFASREDGQFGIGVKIVGFTEVFEGGAPQ